MTRRGEAGWRPLLFLDAAVLEMASTGEISIARGSAWLRRPSMWALSQLSGGAAAVATAWMDSNDGAALEERRRA